MDKPACEGIAPVLGSKQSYGEGHILDALDVIAADTPAIDSRLTLQKLDKGASVRRAD